MRATSLADRLKTTMPRRPIHQLRQYYYNDIDGAMETDRNHQLDTYQQGPEPPQQSNLPPINININLGEILAGLGLGELIKAAAALKAGKVNEDQPKVSKKKLIDAIAQGAPADEVAELLEGLEARGMLE
jgi:hypothetical protein